MSSFSSWGVPSALIMKPEITTPGGNIYSLDGVNKSGKAYVNNSGTSMAAPQAAGMTAVIAQYIRETGLDTKTGLTVRQLAQSLLMSTAVPLREKASGGNYYSILNQGSGLANVGNAVTSNSYIMMDANATASYADGKVKAELGDDPDRTGEYSFSFTLNNLTDAANGYTLGADIFTQSLSSGKYLSKRTTAIAADVTYLVDGKVFNPSSSAQCDLDKDGDTDADDAQIVLNYTVGKITEIDTIADVDGDGTINTYDAHLLLSSLGTDELVVAAGGKASITVKVTLSDSVKAALDAEYVNGAYLEGYVWVRPTSDAEGVFTDVTHSIPILGYYGNWTEPSMYEKGEYVTKLYGDETSTYLGLKNYNALTLKYEGGTTAYYQYGNPYLVEETSPLDRMAINGATNMSTYKISLIRNAAAVATFVQNEAGEVLYVSTPSYRNFGAYYATSANMWYSSSMTVGLGKSPAKLGFEEGDTVIAGVVAIPEYYAENGTLTADDIKALIENDVLGEGAYRTTAMVVDNTDPVVTDVVKYTDGDNEGVTVTASDDNYIAAIQVADEDGILLTTVAVPDQTEKNQTCTVSIDLTDLYVGEKCIVAVADYAGNISTYMFRFGGDNKYIVPGTIFAWAKVKDRGETKPRWSQIDPDTLWYVDEENFSGTTTVSYTSYEADVRAAEYIEGYVFFLDNDGCIYRAKHGKWDRATYFADTSGVVASGVTMRDLAADYLNRKVYLCSDKGKIYSMDMDTGVITYEFSVSLTNPNSNTAKHKLPYAITIDDNGRFYATNYPRKDCCFLYTWTLDDVVTTTDEDGTVTRSITDLAPINNTAEGNIALGYNVLRLQMAWDHDADKIYILPSSNTTKGSTNNLMFTVDTTTGLATPVNEYLPEGQTTGSAVSHSEFFGLYVVPSETTAILPDIYTATSIQVSAPRTDVLVGAAMKLTYEVGPWNLDDKSVTWSSSDESIATVDADGKVSFHAVGTVTITATTVLKPFLQDSVEINVANYPATQLTAAVANADGSYHISEFNTSDLSTVTSILDLDVALQGGGYHDGLMYYHDGVFMLTLDRETLELQNQGALKETWLWSDATTAPRYDIDCFNQIVAICGDGQFILLLNRETGVSKYYDLSRFFLDDPMAVITYGGFYQPKDSETGNTFYILTEGGVLRTLHFYCSAITGYDSFYARMESAQYATGIELMGVGAIGNDNYGSLIYDEETGYLLLTRTLTGEGTDLYAIDPNNGITAPIGSFSEDVSYVTGMYEYIRATELTVRPSATTVNMYSDETYDLDVQVLPISNDQTVTWESSDSAIATVDENGVVTAKAAGTVTITVTSKAVNDAGAPVSAQVTVNITAVQSMTTEFHAQITDATGTYWAKINTGDLSITKEGQASVVLTGAGAHNGKIYGTDSDYASDKGHLYAIDPNDGYSVVTGALVDAENAPLDMTTMPLLITNALNNTTGTELFETGDMPAYITSSRSAKLLAELETGTHAPYLVNLSKNRGVCAVAYGGLGKVAKYDAHIYYILEHDGDVHQLNYYPKYSSSKLTYTSSFVQNVAKVAESFEDDTKVTMTYLSDETYTGLLIAYSGNVETELYFLDMSGDTYVTSKIGTLRGVTNLVGAYLDSEIAAPETDSATGEAIVLPGIVEETAVSEPVNVPAGSTNAVALTLTGEEELLPQAAEGSATETGVALKLTETEASTNGKIIVTYDPSLLTYQNYGTLIPNTAINVDAENGRIIFTYASANAVAAGDMIATINFSYAKDYVDTTVSAETEERNDQLVDEAPVTVEITFEVGGHDYQVTETKASTCVEAGYTVYTCSKCGDSYQEALPLGEHSYEAEVTEPTCTEAGYTTYTCAVCGDSYQADYTDPKGHSFGAWEAVLDPGCETKGQEKRTCADCGEVEYRDTAPTGHSYVAAVTEPTCTAMGYTTYTCAACGISYKSDYVSPKGHSYEAEVTAPTCTEMGYTTYTCAVCGDSYKADWTVPTGHSFGDWTVVTAATCTEKGQEKRVCACGAAEYRDIAVTGHSYEQVVTAPTCTEMGCTTYTCAVCGDSYKSDWTAPTGHSFGDWVVVTAATCTAAGEETRTCACGAAETRQIPALGHSYEREIIAATCTEFGYEMDVCALCGASRIAGILYPTGHSYVKTVTEATCTEDGCTTYTCPCGDSYVTDYVAATGHSFGQWTVTREETCTEDGQRTRVCAACGTVETEVIPAYCPAESYSDLDTKQWYHEGVCFVLRKGIMKGKDTAIFAPGDTLTRAELVTTLYRMAGEPSVEGMENPFEDVAADTWYTDAVVWAVNNGVVNGTSATTFTPNSKITREQIAAILYRYSGAEEVGEDHLKDFTDAGSISAYAVEAMNWAVANGLI